MEDYIKIIDRYNGNINVIRNMLFASACHDIEYKTNWNNELHKYVQAKYNYTEV